MWDRYAKLMSLENLIAKAMKKGILNLEDRV